eukprot:4883799-Prymnesium_polylepis.1
MPRLNTQCPPIVCRRHWLDWDLGDLYPIAVGADEGVGPQGPAYLAVLRERNGQVSKAVSGAVELEPAEGLGVQAPSDAN